MESVQELQSARKDDAHDSTVASLSAVAAHGGVVHCSGRHSLSMEGVGLNPESDSASPQRVLTRKVGAQYLIQVLLTGLPLLIVDVLALTTTICACRMLFFELRFVVGIDVSHCLLPITTGFILLNIELGLYPGVRLSPVEEFRRLVVSVTCMFIVWAVGVAVLTGGLETQRWFLLVLYTACSIVLPVCRGWVRRMLGKWTRWGIPVLVCGDDVGAFKLFNWLASNRHLGLRPVGVIADQVTPEFSGSDPHYLGSWSDTHEIAVRKGIYWAVVVPSRDDPADISSLMVEYLSTIPHIHVLSELTGLPDSWSPHRQLEGLTGIHLQQNLMLPLPRMMKRCMDLVAAVIGGLLLMPLLFYISVAVKMSSRGPILYGHDRIGKDGRHFKAWKFRSMFQNSHDVLEQYLDQHPILKEEWDRDHKLKYDPRITRIGRFMRLTSIDELPQLWNVIRGEMSLVGPRPIVTAEIAKYGPYYGLYTMVTPGITGLWQVSGRNDTTYDERVQLDSYYVRNWSPWMDLYLLVRTIRIVLFAEGAY
jgi:Undecaprenyl-phosphate galactose phosphotransferase WbaP